MSDDTQNGGPKGAGYTFINTFEIAPDAVDTFCERWIDRSRHMRDADGFISATLYRAVNGDARFKLVNVSDWTSPEALAAAGTRPEYRQELAKLFADLDGKLVANRGDYGLVARFEADSKDEARHISAEADNGSEAAAIIERARQLAPSLQARAMETEQLRHLPDSIIADAEAAGIFSLLVPRAFGGAGGDARDYVELARTLATGDTSAAWTLAFFTVHAWLVARYPIEAQQDLFGDGRRPRVSFVGRPPGEAIPTDGGFLISGEWGYASGVMNADWVQVPAVIAGSSWTPAMGFDGQSLFLVPRAEVEVLDTWNMAGMAGTGSHDIKMERVFVPAHRTIDFGVLTARENPGSAIHPEPVFGYSLSDVMMYTFPALAVGCAEAVLADHRRRLERQRAAYSPTLSVDTQAGQIRYARAFSALRLAQMMLRQAIEESTRAAEDSSQEKSDELRATLKLDCLSICRMAREAVEIVVEGSGTSMFKRSDPTQRRVRDMMTMLSHVSIDLDGMQSRAGEILLGRATAANPAQVFV